MKRKIKKLHAKLLNGKPYRTHTIKLNRMIHINAYGWRDSGKILYEVRGWIDTKPFSRTAGWSCFYSRTICDNGFKRLHKKIAKALHKYLEVDCGL